MGFLSIVRKLREKEKEMKLLIIGLDNAGKTTIIRRFNGEPIDTIAPTLGFDIKTLQHKQYTPHIDRRWADQQRECTDHHRRLRHPHDHLEQPESVG